MDWTILIVAVVVIAGFVLLKRASFISAAAARQHLANGALVIDVRSPEEFRGERVPGAINIPLGELRERLPEQVKDKHQVLLLHCLSGGRSGIARQQVRAMGYVNAFNLGGYSRAQRIVRSRTGE